MALKSAITVAIVAAIIAGCARPTTTESPAPATLAPSATAGIPTTAPTTPPTADPIESPEPTAGVVCPSDLPTDLASVEELADPSCYGATELTINGWLAEQGIWIDMGETEPSWTMAWSALYSDSPTAGEWMVDYLLAEQQLPPRISVVARPASDIDLSGLGRWVTLRGHFNDEKASACRQILRGWDPDEHRCDRLFVVSSVEGRPATGPVCPTGSPITIEEFLAADARCYRGRDVQLIGWEDIGEGFGGTSPRYPITLSPSLRYPDAQLVERRFESGDPGPIIFPMTVVGGVKFNASDHRAIVTGQLGHAAALKCRPGPYSPWTWTPPVKWAQHFCQRIFIVTGVQDRD